MSLIRLLKLFVLSIWLSSPVAADSSCWPEEELVGTPALGYIGGFSYLFPKNAKGACEIEAFDSPKGGAGKAMPCGDLRCIKGACDGGGDYTALPVLAQSGFAVEVLTQGGRRVWLRLKKTPSVELALPSGKEGRIHPAATPLLNSPGGRPLKLPSRKEIGLKLLSVQTIGKQEWAKVEIHVVQNAEPPVQLGPSLGVGFFQFRGADGKIKAVLSDIWCD